MDASGPRVATADFIGIVRVWHLKDALISGSGGGGGGGRDNPDTDSGGGGGRGGEVGGPKPVEVLQHRSWLVHDGHVTSLWLGCATLATSSRDRTAMVMDFWPPNPKENDDREGEAD